MRLLSVENQPVDLIKVQQRLLGNYSHLQIDMCGIIDRSVPPETSFTSTSDPWFHLLCLCCDTNHCNLQMNGLEISVFWALSTDPSEILVIRLWLKFPPELFWFYCFFLRWSVQRLTTVWDKLFLMIGVPELKTKWKQMKLWFGMTTFGRHKQVFQW